MRKYSRLASCIAGCLFFTIPSASGTGDGKSIQSAPTELTARSSIILNSGQWDAQVLACLRGPVTNIWLTSTGLVFDANVIKQAPTSGTFQANAAYEGSLLDVDVVRDVIGLDFDGGRIDPSLLQAGPQIGVCNFILGADSDHWVRDVPVVSSLTCENVFPGVALVLETESEASSLGFVATAGDDLSAVRLRTGSLPTGVSLSAVGDMLKVPGRQGAFTIRTDGGNFKHLVTGNSVTFSPAQSAPSSATGSMQSVTATIDYSSFLGGTQYDVINGMVLADDGSIIVVGNTESAGFPTANALDPSFNGGTFGDVFVTRFSNDGSGLTYSTFVGGAGADISTGIVLDSDGGPIVTGITGSLGTFPLLAGYDSTYAGAGDGFVLKLSATGSTLEYSTLVGGINEDYPRAIAIDASGSVYITGHTRSIDFPAVGGLDGSFNGGAYDAFVCKFTGDGSVLAYSGYVGGGADDQAFGIAVDAIGRAHIRGWTASVNFPTATPYDNSFNGGDRDAFLTRLNSAGSALEYSTYLGGISSDYGVGLVLDDSGRAIIAGVTRSSDFPMVNALDDAIGGTQDLFVAKFDSSGQSLEFSTYLGGGAEDFNGLATIDDCGQIYATGYTYSTDYPLMFPHDSTFGGGADLVLTGLAADGSQLIYSSFIGGSNVEFPNAILVHFSSVYLAGLTNSADFPREAAYDSTLTGDYDGFVASVSGVGVNECGCSCACHADPACDGVRNDILDVVRAVNVAFRGAQAIIDPSPTCPNESTDANCNGSTDVIDVVKFIGVAFRGGNPSVDYCDPCAP